MAAYLLHRLRQLGWSDGRALAVSAVLRGSYHLYQGLAGSWATWPWACCSAASTAVGPGRPARRRAHPHRRGGVRGLRSARRARVLAADGLSATWQLGKASLAFVKRLVRRGAAVPALAVAALALASCSSGAPPTVPTASSGAWTFTDDVGVTVTLDRAPERVASYADYALGLHSLDVDPSRSSVACRWPPTSGSPTTTCPTSPWSATPTARWTSRRWRRPTPTSSSSASTRSDGEGTLDLEGPANSLQDTAQQQQLEAIAPLITIEVGGKGQDVVDSLNRLALAWVPSSRPSTRRRASSTPRGRPRRRRRDVRGRGDPDVRRRELGHLRGQARRRARDGALPPVRGRLHRPESGRRQLLLGRLQWENASQMSTGDVLLVNVEASRPTTSPPSRPSPATRRWWPAGARLERRGDGLPLAGRAHAELAEILRSSQDVNPA